MIKSLLKVTTNTEISFNEDSIHLSVSSAFANTRESGDVGVSKNASLEADSGIDSFTSLGSGTIAAVCHAAV